MSHPIYWHQICYFFYFSIFPSNYSIVHQQKYQFLQNMSKTARKSEKVGTIANPKLNGALSGSSKLNGILSSSSKLNGILSSSPKPNSTLSGSPKPNNIISGSSRRPKVSSPGSKRSNRSLVTVCRPVLVQISQQDIIFVNTEVGEEYEFPLWVKNVGQKSIKLTVIGPKNPDLGVAMGNTLIAPGLDSKILVEYRCQKEQEIRDKIVLYSKDQLEIEVPINVYPCVNHLDFESFIDLGFMKIGATHERKITLSNLGSKPAEVSLEPNVRGATITLIPQWVTIPPNNSHDVLVRVTGESDSPAQVEGTISIQPSPILNQSIELRGSFCEYDKFIGSVTRLEPISELALSPLFGGERTSVSFSIVNNTPQKCGFRIVSKKGMSYLGGQKEETFMITPQEFGEDDSSKILTFQPTEGQLEAYSTREITCQVTAKAEEADHQLFCNLLAGKLKPLHLEARPWSYIIKTHFHGEDSAKKITIHGSTVIPQLSLSATFFQFGDSALRSKSTRALKVQNQSDRPLSLLFQHSHNYSFSPARLELEGEQGKQVEVVFRPKVVGEINEVCFLRVGEFQFPIKMLGKGLFINPSGPQKTLTPSCTLPEQFQAQKLSAEEESEMASEQSYFEGKKNSLTNFDLGSMCPKLDGMRKEQGGQKKWSIKDRQGKEVQIDISNFNADEVVEEYPGPNKSVLEERSVMKGLGLGEFKNIPVGPIVVEMGDVFLKTHARKTFHICNLNFNPISIQLEVRNQPEFERSSRNIQILSPESHGGLAIWFCPSKQGPFRHNLQYIINGRHYFELKVAGQAILPTLSASRTDFKFLATEEDHSFEKKEYFSLSNDYPYKAEFCFLNEENSLFKFSPAKGVVGPKSKVEVKVTHNFLEMPEGGGRHEEAIKLKVLNGIRVSLRCVSVLPECSVVPKPSEINFKEVSIGRCHEFKFCLRNTSRNCTYLQIVAERNMEEHLHITFPQKSVSPDEVVEVALLLNCSHDMVVDSFVTVIARGARKITIPVRAHAIVPIIRIEGDTINFGSMPVASNSKRHTLTLVNDSPIPAELELILAQDSFMQRCLAVLPNHSLSPLTISQPRESRERKCKIYTIMVPKKRRGEMMLEFTPDEVKGYRFLLPLYLTGSIEPLPSLQKEVVCRSLKNKLVADQKLVDFGRVIIEKNFEKATKSRVLTLKNPLDEFVSWWAGKVDPFSLGQEEGVLGPCEEVELTVLFLQEMPGEFEREVQFFIDKTDLEPEKPYLSVLLRVSASYPEIYFDRPYVILPVVGLNAVSSAQFEVTNGGYENLNLKHLISAEYSHINLNVKYLNGPNLGIARKSLTVEVSFSSQKAISFTLKIEFYDSSNRIFSVLVSGTADDSLYCITHAEWEGQEEQEAEDSASFLRRYLNGLALGDDLLIQHFPDFLTHNDYQGVEKFLLNFSPSFEKLDRLCSSARKESPQENTLAVHEYLGQVIKKLKSEGAYLSEIRPEFLMREAEFTTVIQEQSPNPRILSHYVLPTGRAFQLQRVKAWTILMYQILKVYSKVPIKKKVAEFWSIFSLREKAIISWFEQSYQSEAVLQEPRSSQNLSNLADGEMLSALITKYTNIKILEQYGRICLSEKERKSKCRKVIQILHQIGISGTVRAEDLYRSKPREMLIFLEKLYLTLPSYLQKGEPVLFSCALGQTLTKSIEVKNPSKFTVTYLAKVEGSKAYTIEDPPEFSIEPKKKHQVRIRYSSNMDLDNKNATLTLAGVASPKFTPSTFIFVLKGQNLGKISEKVVQVLGVLYEPHEFQLSVKNTLGADACLTAQVVSAKGCKVQEKSLILTSQSVKAKKDEVVPISFVFLPFCATQHKYEIMFRDSSVGEFQYELVGLVEPPPVIQDPIIVSQVFFTNTTSTAEVSIPIKNELIVKARKTWEELVGRKLRRNSLVSKQSRVSQLEQLQKKTLIMPKRADLPIARSPTYSVPEVQTFHLSLTPKTETLTLKTNTLTIEQEKEGSTYSKRITLQANMKCPVRDGFVYLSMKNSEGTDIRKYKLFINCVYKPLKYELEMRVIIKNSLTQPIPLINISDNPNEFQVSLSSAHCSSTSDFKNSVGTPLQAPTKASQNVFQFTGQKGLIVGPGEQTTCDLIFTPKSQQVYTGVIKVENLTTGQLVEYEVTGHGEEPIPETLHFQQFTNETKCYELPLGIQLAKSHRIKVVKCTFPEAHVRYEKTTLVNEAQQPSAFKFQFSSKLAKKFEGRIYLDDQTKIHAFQVFVNVEQHIEGELELNVLEREKETMSLPMEGAGHWKIEHDDPGIEIASEVDLKEGQRIQFAYQSAKIGNRQSHITLINEAMGSFKYFLNVFVKGQPDKVIDGLEAELGKTYSHPVFIENANDYPITVQVSLSNEGVFYAEPGDTFQLPSMSTEEIKLIYRPTCLDKESGKVYLTSDNNQKWKYELIGRGLLQKNEEVVEVEAEVNEQIIKTINFTNPFKDPINIHILLLDEFSTQNSPKEGVSTQNSPKEGVSTQNSPKEGVSTQNSPKEGVSTKKSPKEGVSTQDFQLLSKSRKVFLEQMEETSIGVRFLGKEIKMYQGRLRILVNEKIYWDYLIEVKMLCRVSHDSRVIRLPIRKGKEVNLSFELPHLPALSDGESVQCWAEAAHQEMQQLFKGVHHIAHEAQIIKDGRVPLLIKFLSYKPFTCPLNFSFVKGDLSRWIFKGEVIFEMAEPDDRFEIVSEVRKASSVIFRQANRVKNSAKFRAYMTPDSDMDISLSPKTGVLEPFGREGTPFKVIFAPTQHKNSWQGKIIIETEDSFWSYIAVGKLPHYEPPIGKSLIRADSPKSHQPNLKPK